MLKGHSSLPLIFRIAILLTLTWVVFFQVRHNDFLTLDDDKYVSDNPYIQSGFTPQAVGWAFKAGLTQKTNHTDYWQPAVVLSRLLDYRLFGKSAAAHHVMNLVYHSANVVLVFLFFWRLARSLDAAFFLAAIFAIHPLQVEPVSWVTARKDMISVLWAMICLHSYLSFVNEPQTYGAKPRRGEGEHKFDGRINPAKSEGRSGVNKNPRRREFWLTHAPEGHGLQSMDEWPPPSGAGFKFVTTGFCTWGSTFVSFILALMSKPVMIVLPVILKLIGDFTGPSPARGRRRYLPLMPFFLVSLAYVSIPFIGQPGVFDHLSKSSLSALVIDRYVWYAGKFLWPVRLGMYGGWLDTTRWSAGVLIKAIMVAAVTGTSFWLHRRQPALWAGWQWFIVALIPVVALEWAGDRFMYFPIIGLLLMLCPALSFIKGRGATIGAAVVIFLLAALSYRQGAYWRNTESLFLRALAINERNYWAHNSLGALYSCQNKYDLARRHLLRAIQLKPDDIKAINNMASLYIKLEKYQEAFNFAYRAYLINKDFVPVLSNLGVSLEHLGDDQESIVFYLRGLCFEPQDPSLQENFSNYLKRIGRAAPSWNGYYRRYYAGHHLSREAVFKNGLLEGPFKVYFENGDLILKQEYKNGIPAGAPERYFLGKRLPDFVPQ
jgi:protein O-mannosyl-transferase